jgi:hypothetical protein
MRALPRVARRMLHAFGHGKQGAFGRQRFRSQELAVVVIDKEGTVIRDTLSVADMLRGRTYQVRDFVSLGIDVDVRAKRPPAHPGANTASPVLFTRGQTILCGIGGLQALIYTDKAIIFEGPQKMQTESFANELGALLQERLASAEGGGEKGLSMGVGGEAVSQAAALQPESTNDDAACPSTDGDFEMMVVEGMLQASCHSFDRRYVIYERMLRHLTSDDESNDAYKLQRLVPVRDSLQQFSMEINETREMLLTLLDNEQGEK